MTAKDDCSTPKMNITQTDQKPANPCILIIFGITGDLAKRLLLPALCNLGSNKLLDEKFCIVGTGRKPYTTGSLQDEMLKNIKQFVHDPDAAKYGQDLAKRINYVRGDVAKTDLYLDLKNQLDALSEKNNSKNYIFYFAVPPENVIDIAKGLHQSGLLKETENNFRRIIIEKPFGEDLESAKKLNQELSTLVEEKQMYRIDHFLGKETVQNLLTFRFLNGIFESIWNHHNIDHVQITVAETIGVEARGVFYDKTGALRDMVPNHMFQMLSLLAMESPISIDPEPIQNEKTKVLRSTQKVKPEHVLAHVVRGQYGPGKIDEKEVPGYRSEANVPPQ